MAENPTSAFDAGLHALFDRPPLEGVPSCSLATLPYNPVPAAADNEQAAAPHAECTVPEPAASYKGEEIEPRALASPVVKPSEPGVSPQVSWPMATKQPPRCGDKRTESAFVALLETSSSDELVVSGRKRRGQAAIIQENDVARVLECLEKVSSTPASDRVKFLLTVRAGFRPCKVAGLRRARCSQLRVTRDHIVITPATAKRGT